MNLLVNFFLRINKPGFPMKVFRDEDAAMAWLLSMCPEVQSEPEVAPPESV